MGEIIKDQTEVWTRVPWISTKLSGAGIQTSLAIKENEQICIIKEEFINKDEYLTLKNTSNCYGT